MFSTGGKELDRQLTANTILNDTILINLITSSAFLFHLCTNWIVQIEFHCIDSI